MQFQTRSEINGLNFFDSLEEAYQHAMQDLTVWKISFAIGDSRIRLIKRELKGKIEWISEPIITPSIEEIH